MIRGRVPHEHVRRRPNRGVLVEPRDMARSAHTELSRAVAGAIALYHIITGLFILLGFVKKWRQLGSEMRRNHTLTFEDYDKSLIRPFAFHIASYFMFFALGVLLFLGVSKQRRHYCEAWLSCTATIDFFTIIRGSEFDYPKHGIVWDVLKSICELCVVWSYTMDLRKDEMRLAALDRSRRLVNARNQTAEDEINNNNEEEFVMLDPNTNQAIP